MGLVLRLIILDLIFSSMASAPSAKLPPLPAPPPTAPPSATNSSVWMEWVSGSRYTGQAGQYGQLGVPVAENIPGGRISTAMVFDDQSKKLYLFGGNGLGNTTRSPGRVPV